MSGYSTPAQDSVAGRTIDTRPGGDAAEGADIPADSERNRRISPAEEARIVAHLETCRDGAETAEDRAQYEALRVMFQLALRTAMRLCEIFTLTRDRLRLDQRRAFLDRKYR